MAVLLKIYAHCIDGQATAANQCITEALGAQDTEQDPGDESDDMEQASSNGRSEGESGWGWSA